MLLGIFTSIYPFGIGLIIALFVWILTGALPVALGLNEDEEDKKEKNEFHHRSSGKVISIIIIILLAVLIIIIGFVIYQSSRRASTIVSEERQILNVSKVNLNGLGHLTIKQGIKESLEIKASENIINKIDTRVSDGTLIIEPKNNWAFWDFLWNKNIDIYLTVKNVNEVKISGSGSVYSSSLVTDNFNLAISGSGDANLNITALKISSTISGSGNILLSGKTLDQELTINGAGNYKASDLSSKFTTISINGSGDAKVNAETKLKVAITGSGKLEYKGNPEINQNISGSGKIEKMSD